MEKAIVNMTQWSVYVYNEVYNLSGIADNHPKLGKETFVSYTSKLIRSEVVDDVLTYETKNTIYVCPLKFMNRRPYITVIPKYKEELTHREGGSAPELDRLIAATACIALEKVEENPLAKHIRELQRIGEQELQQMEEAESKRMYKILEDYADSVYIEVSNVDEGNKLAYHLGEKFGIVKPSLHSGMFQDSVLYMLYASEESDGCSLDFRYFPRGLGDVMETYSWSDNIQNAIIKNECSHILYFNGEKIEPGDTKVFTPQNHSQGLISPDCYNGKSLMSFINEVLAPEEQDSEDNENPEDTL